MSDTGPFQLSPEEALKWFREKGYALTFDHRELYGRQHARAFTVAKATQLDLLSDIRTALDKALREGRTLAEFRKGLRPLLQQRGWWGEQEMVDPETGEKKLVQLGSAARLRTIYQTNMRQAQAAGRWERFERVKAARPYGRYVCLLDGRERPEHRAWHNTVLPLDHPWWQTHAPPNGWGCRCKMQQLSERDLARFGLEVTRAAPEDTPRVYTNERTGARVVVPKGIDPGFDYNPGTAPRGYVPGAGDKELSAPPLADSKTWKDLGLPSAAEIVDTGGLGPSPGRWLNVKSLADADARYVALFGSGKPVDVVDPDGVGVTFAAKLLEHLTRRGKDLDRVSYLPQAKATIESPTEVWLQPHRIENPHHPEAGRVVMRKVYVKVFGDSSLKHAVVAQADDNGYVAYTVHPTTRLDEKRHGYLLSAAPRPTVAAFQVDRSAAQATVERLGERRVELRMIPIGRIAPPSAWSPAKAAAIGAAVAAGKALPPVRLLRDEKGGFVLSDGNHRLAAALAAGHTHVPAIVDRRRGG